MLSCLVAAGQTGAVEIKSSALEREHQKVKFGLVWESDGDINNLAYNQGFAAGAASSEYREKSPVKAFLLSLAVPGAGQWYYGSRIKPFVFLGVEVAAWGFHIKFHGDGEDQTDAFEAYNREHWSRSTYEDYIRWTYDAPSGDDNDVNISTYPEVSHHLPDTRTQQYYEMTGKYDQFAWGWDDAELDERTFYADFSSSDPPPRFLYNDSVPNSSHRDQYETMRDDANAEFDKATKMIFVSMANRLASAVEALVMTNVLNKKRGGNEDEEEDGSFLSRLKFKPSLKSIHSTRDTPYVKVTYRF